MSYRKITFEQVEDVQEAILRGGRIYTKKNHLEFVELTDPADFRRYFYRLYIGR